jgi:hypothetical protein
MLFGTERRRRQKLTVVKAAESLADKDARRAPVGTQRQIEWPREMR